MTDVCAGFRPPCWCPCTWPPTWRLHTNLYKFAERVSLHIFHKKNCCDLNLGESLCISTFFLFLDSGLNLLNGFDFFILNGVTLKTSNRVSLICLYLFVSQSVSPYFGASILAITIQNLRSNICQFPRGPFHYLSAPPPPH